MQDMADCADLSGSADPGPVPPGGLHRIYLDRSA